MARIQLAVACLAATGLAGLLACADDPGPAPLAFGEVCGQRAPVRLLELPPGRQLASDTTPFRVGDRFYFKTSRVDGDADLASEAWSTGPCGETPRRLATDVVWLSTQRERWPGVVLACLQPRDPVGPSAIVVALDPHGGDPTPLLPGVQCEDFWSDHGVISTDDSDDGPFARLLLYPYPSDPRDPAMPASVLHPEILHQPRSRLRSRLGEVFALDADTNLLHIDLGSGEITVQATDVLDFRVALDEGRYLLWQANTTPTTPDQTASAVILQDRVTGISVALGTTVLAYTPDAAYHVAEGVVPLWFDDDRTVRLFRLPDLSVVDLPLDHEYKGVIDDHRVLVGARNQFTLAIHDSLTDELTLPTPRPGELLDFTPERALFLLNDDFNGGDGPPLLALRFDGSEPRVVARRAHQYARTYGDTHLVTPVEDADPLRSPLALVDLDNATEQIIDVLVPPHSFYLDADFGPDHLVYSVDDGARSGIYVARLPAQ